MKARKNTRVRYPIGRVRAAATRNGVPFRVLDQAVREGPESVPIAVLDKVMAALAELEKEGKA